MFGRKVKLHSVQDALGFRWREELVKARRIVCVQLILNNRDALGSWKVNIDQFTHALCPIGLGSSIGDLDVAPILQRSKEHECVGHSFTVIFIIVPFRLAWHRRQRLARFTHQLLRTLVNANQRIPGIFWSFVNVQHIFHVVHKVGIRIRGNAPLFLGPRLDFVVA